MDLRKLVPLRVYRWSSRCENFFQTFLWGWLTGFNVFDAAYYNPFAPKWMKQFVWRLKNYHLRRAGAYSGDFETEV